MCVHLHLNWGVVGHGSGQKLRINSESRKNSHWNSFSDTQNAFIIIYRAGFLMGESWTKSERCNLNIVSVCMANEESVNVSFDGVKADKESGMQVDNQ